MNGLMEKLLRIQTELKVPKNLYNEFGKYKYRSAEGICEAAKPFLAREKCLLLLSDEMIVVGERVYVKATATLRDLESDEKIEVFANAREAQDKKGADDSQITGMASSYARKYALNGLFLLDDTKDADDENMKAAEEFDKQVKEVGKMKIAKMKVDAITKKCADDGVDVQKVLTLYKIKKFEDMTENQFRNAMDNWSKIKEM
ncbi:MAG: ERF family protein [Lachnospiraceae bacterium]|nr:ERF family protein [Lachnospiraceae bacterium]